MVGRGLFLELVLEFDIVVENGRIESAKQNEGIFPSEQGVHASTIIKGGNSMF